jgi:fibronectin type 3 domain-containing protein
VTPTSATKASLFWQATPGSLPIGPITYGIFRGTSLSNLKRLAETTVPFYEDAGLQPASTFLYLVNATSNGLTLSGTACTTTPSVPSPPYDITATPLSPTTVKLSWAQHIDSDSLAIAEFRVYAGTSPSDLTLVANVRNVSVELNEAAGTTYYYLVVAVDVDGDASAASTIEVTMPNHLTTRIRGPQSREASGIPLLAQASARTSRLEDSVR